MIRKKNHCENSNCPKCVNVEQEIGNLREPQKRLHSKYNLLQYCSV